MKFLIYSMIVFICITAIKVYGEERSDSDLFFYTEEDMSFDFDEELENSKALSKDLKKISLVE